MVDYLDTKSIIKPFGDLNDKPLGFFMSRNKRIYKDDVVYEIITNTWNNVPIFTDKKACKILIDKIWLYQNKYKFNIYTYSISPCHLNILFKPKFGKQISDIMHDIKGTAMGNIMKLLKNNQLFNYKYVCNKNCFCKFATLNSMAVAQGFKTLGYHAFENDCPSINHYYRDKDGSIKSFKLINPAITNINNFKKYGHIWDTGFYDHYIRNQDEFIEKINYFYYNNKKHHINDQYDKLFKQFRFINPKYKKYLNNGSTGF